MAKEAIKAEESENNARTRAEAPRPTSSAPITTRQGPTTTRHRPPAAQRIRLGLDEGDEAWLTLEKVASIIQLYNKGQTGCNIVTTLLQGTERKDWDKVWKHMRVAEETEAENTGGPTPRVRDRLMTYGQLLFRHKKEGISGIYPMNMPGHWRVMIVSHILRQVLLLDPFGDASEPYGFTTDDVCKTPISGTLLAHHISSCSGRLYRHALNTNLPDCRSNDVTTNRSHRGHEPHRQSRPLSPMGGSQPPPLWGGPPTPPPLRGGHWPTLNPPLRRGRGQPLDPQGRHNGDIHTTRRRRRVEDNWDMRVDDPLCVALAPAALQM
jgi:hypothetical protein